MATTTIATEGARPSLSQNIEALYANLHVGGAYDAKAQIVTTGHNELVDGIVERTHTVRGFKANWNDGLSEFLMVRDGVETTRMLVSVYGHHSTAKYWNM